MFFTRFFKSFFLFLFIFSLFTGTASAIQCYECHGSKTPPDYRPIDSGYRNITTGGFQGNHRTHMDINAAPITCAKCHPGSDTYRTDHRDAQIKVASNINNSPALQRAVYKNSTSAFPQTPTPSLGTCANVNCHFEKETPPWGSTDFVYPGNCSSCHGAPPAGTTQAPGSAGSHPKHDQYFTGIAKCGYCHPSPTTFSHATSAGRNLIVNPRHTADSQIGRYNGLLNDYLPANRPGRTFGTCSDFYCHSNGTGIASGLSQTFTTAEWGSGAISCSACHGNPPNYTNQTPKANSHPKHDLYGFSCNKCHAATTSTGTTITNLSNHVNKFYNISAGGGVKFRYTYSPTGGTCTTNTCHHDGTSVATGIPNSPYSAIWGASVSCTSCHLSPPNYTSGSPKANNHTRHNTLGFTCNKCHASTTADGTTITSAANHANGFYNISGGAGVYLKYTFYANGGVCSSNSCHNDGTAIATGVIRSTRTAKWGAALTCNICHASRPDYPNGSPKANNHQAMVHRQDCITCHSATVSSNTTLLPGTTVHENGAYNIVGSTPFNYTYSPTGGICSNVVCHASRLGERKWSATADKCDGCHDCPPNTAAHRIHYSGNATQANYSSTGTAAEGASGYLFNCGNCHPRDINLWHREGTVQVELYDPNAPPGSIKANPENINATYTPGSTVYTDSRGYEYTNGTCENVYCHSYRQWTTPGGTLTTTRIYKSPTWGGTLPKDCTGCHDNPPKTYMSNNADAAGDSHYYVLSGHYNTYYDLWDQGHSNKNWFPIDPVPCKACHNDTVKVANKWTRTETQRFTTYSGVQIFSYAKHVNGKNDVAFDRTGQYKFTYFDIYSQEQTVFKNLSGSGYTPGTKTCSNVSCHRTQTAVQWGQPYNGYNIWESGDMSQCNRCHADDPKGY